MQKIPKKWRDLSVQEKLDIPISKFKFKKSTIQKIRNIPDSKKRLLEAARLQFNNFGEIHSYLTAWIAGYGSDIVIRKFFGSTKNLRENFIKTPKYEHNISPSWNDIKKGICVPHEMSLELAEETGIHIGDGNLYFAKDKNGYPNYRYGITGDLQDESIYHKEYIALLMKKIYNIQARFIERPKKGCIESFYSSKAIVEFKNKVLGLTLGSKKNIHIPKTIIENPDFMKKCITGIIDTDFSITEHLAISGKFHSLYVAEEIHQAFVRFGIKHIYKKEGDHARFYISQESALKIIKEWKMHNQKHLSKYELYNKFKTYIPFTTTSERLMAIQNKITLKQLTALSKKRKASKNLQE